MGMYDIYFLTGPRAGVLIPVSCTILVGRGKECAVEVPDPKASRVHGRLEYDGMVLRVIDLHSANGTFVNEERVHLDDPVVVTHSDIIRIGRTNLLVQECTSQERKRLSRQSSLISFGIRDSVQVSKDMTMSAVDAATLHTTLRSADVRTIEDEDTTMPTSLAALPSVLCSDAKLRAVMDVAETLVTITRLEDMYGPIIDTLFEVFTQVERAFLMLGGTVEKLEPQLMRQRGQATTEDLQVSLSVCQEALEKKQLVIFSQDDNPELAKRQSMNLLQIRHAMAIPLVVKDEVLGLLVMDTTNKRGSFREADGELAVCVCRQIAIALKNAMLVEKVEQQAKMRDSLRRFLSRPVLEQVLEGRLDIKLGGQDGRATILFSDVISFTRLSESLTAMELIEMMNRYFNRVVPCIEQHDGAIDKFLGDGIMAFWGIPFQHGNSAKKGTTAALLMQTAMCGFNSEQVHGGRPPLYMGIGLNGGPVVAGNVGATERMEYTVLGNTVNTAQRIESAANRDQVLVSENIWTELGECGYGFRMPPLKVKNKAALLNVFSVRALELHDELVMYIPAICGRCRIVFSRRLIDNTFIVFHPPHCPLMTASITLDLAEWPNITLPPPKEVIEQAEERQDGFWRRSVVELVDPTMQGLLDRRGAIAPCELQWSEMDRTASGSPNLYYFVPENTPGTFNRSYARGQAVTPRDP